MQNLAAIMGLGGGELLLIFAILLLMFGGSKLPGLAKGLGQSVREFKKAAKEGEDDEPKHPESPKKTTEAGKSSGSN